MLKRVPLDVLVVDHRAVGRAEILDDVTVAGEPDLRVVFRRPLVVELYRVLLGAAERAEPAKGDRRRDARRVGVRDLRFLRARGRGIRRRRRIGFGGRGRNWIGRYGGRGTRAPDPFEGREFADVFFVDDELDAALAEHRGFEIEKIDQAAAVKILQRRLRLFEGDAHVFDGEVDVQPALRLAFGVSEEPV